MANYYGHFRSNYFKVKDIEAFKSWCDSVGVDYWEKSDDSELVAISSSDQDDYGAIPSHESLDPDYDSDTPPPGWTEEEFAESQREIDFLQELSKHLVEGEIAVVVENGQEKMRYLTGYAAAVNHLGELVEININQIYDLAEAKFGTRPNRAEY